MSENREADRLAEVDVNSMQMSFQRLRPPGCDRLQRVQECAVVCAAARHQKTVAIVTFLQGMQGQGHALCNPLDRRGQSIPKRQLL